MCGSALIFLVIEIGVPRDKHLVWIVFLARSMKHALLKCFPPSQAALFCGAMPATVGQTRQDAVLSSEFPELAEKSGSSCSRSLVSIEGLSDQRCP